MASPTWLTLEVTDLRSEAKDVLVIELRDRAGAELPRFAAGAHLEVHLGNGLIRHYSLCNDPAETRRYCIGVGLARESRGGSRFIHRSLRVGMTLKVGPPRNHFPLEDCAPEYAFIAGGIGITPIMAMIRTCEALGRPWRLFYCARNRQRTAFYEELQAIGASRCHFHFDDEQDGRLFDAAAALSSVPDAAHVYTCGPAPLMSAVQAAATHRPAERVHFEWFSGAAAADTSAASDRPFTIVLARSGRRLEVPPGRSILEILEDNGEGIPSACREGLCATCRIGVVSGTPEHRDQVLTEGEKQAGKDIIACVSRSRSEVLELDL